MKYKAFFCDFDGTLCTRDEYVSPENRAAIKRYLAAGGHFILNTGRMTVPTHKILVSLGIDDQLVPMIGYNGAHALSRDGETVFCKFLPLETLAEIIKIAKKTHTYMHFYDDKVVYAAERNEINEWYEHLTGSPIKAVGDLGKYVEAHPELTPMKIMIVHENQSDEEWRGVIEEVAKAEPKGVEYYMTTKNYLEFVSATAGKDEGMREVAAIYEVPLEECIAMGDGQNDIGMIRAAGLGVAPASASAEVRAAADVVAPPADESAVAWVIDKYCTEEI